MRRDWGVIKELLEKFENDTISQYLSELSDIPATSRLDDKRQSKAEEDRRKREDLVFGHLLLMNDAGLIEGLDIQRSASEFLYGENFPRLTMKGHDTLEALRNQTVWDEIKKRSKDFALPITQDLILAVLKHFAGLT